MRNFIFFQIKNINMFTKSEEFHCIQVKEKEQLKIDANVEKPVLFYKEVF